MSVKAMFLAMLGMAALGACAPGGADALTGPPPAPGEAGPTRDWPSAGRRLASECTGRDGWADAAPPTRIYGNSFYVGTCGISVVLITSAQGHILIDSSTQEAVPGILANIRALGFEPRDIRTIIGSHEHVDHMGGFAALKAATGAQIWVSAAAQAALESGEVDSADPQLGIIPGLPRVAVDRVIGDGEVVTVGPNAITAHMTPGHTSGGTSWTWRSCQGPNCARIAYVDSMSAVSRDDYRFTAHPERVAPFRATFDRVGRMPCDILVTPHPGFSNLFERLAGAQPLVDRDACRRLVGTMRTRLDARLARETGS